MAATKPFYLPETVTRFSRLKLLPSRALSTFKKLVTSNDTKPWSFAIWRDGLFALFPFKGPSILGPWACFFFSLHPSHRVKLSFSCNLRLPGFNVMGGCGCGCGCRRRPRALKRHHGDHFSKRGPDLVASQQSLGRFAPDCQPGSTRFPLNPEAGIQGPPTK